MTYDVTVKDVPAIHAAVVRRQATIDIVGPVVRGAFAVLMAAVRTQGAAPAGPPFLITVGEPSAEHPMDLELGVPVGSPFPDTGDVFGRDVDGGTMATTVHRGSYAGIGPAYAALTTWIAEHGHTVAGPPREIYVTDPASVPTPADNVTEVWFPIA